MKEGAAATNHTFTLGLQLHSVLLPWNWGWPSVTRLLTRLISQQQRRGFPDLQLEKLD